MDNAKINKQTERFRKGFPWLEIVAAATPGRGIEQLDGRAQQEAMEYLDSAEVRGRCKFVPASGAASRMFKDIYAGLETPNEACETLGRSIRRFAFYTPELFPEGCNAARVVLEDLKLGSKPKGVLPFHRYADEVRTALAEHMVEGQAYMRNPDGSVDMVVTVSPEHEGLFKSLADELKPIYEKRYGVRYNMVFTFQDPDTDTIAVDMDNKPFLKDDGEPLLRPAGHGALIYNLDRVPQELVSIKNIDNVCVERMQETTWKWKRILMGRALQVRDRIRGYIYALDQLTSSPQIPVYPDIPAYTPLKVDLYATDECQLLCNEIELFLRDELCIGLPDFRSCRERAEYIRGKLDRPVRVCGMVRNEGEPGGGPFIIRAKDGSTSLQILESVQVNPDDPAAVRALAGSTHFNPVDLVCCLLDHEGRHFKLTDHIDEETGFISSKSYQGRELKALELPGLWNGAMSDWNTVFVEVPVETFNPVKVLLDLLRPAHQN